MSMPAFAYTPQEAWFWTPPGGTALPLQSPYGAWNIASMGGSRFGLPVFRGQNYVVPYKAGQSQRQKMPDSRTVTLAMWVDGQGDQTANVYPAANQRLAFNNNLQYLRQQLFQQDAWGSMQGQLQRNWYLTVGGINKLVTATAMAEIAGSMDLTMHGRTNTGFSVDFLLADPFFYGAQQVVACAGGATALTGLGDGTVGLGYPSPVSSFTVAITSPCTVTNISTGVSFSFAGVSDFPVTVDILNETVVDFDGDNFISALSHAGSHAWMTLRPGGNTIAVSAGTATFSWNDCYT